MGLPRFERIHHALSYPECSTGIPSSTGGGLRSEPFHGQSAPPDASNADSGQLRDGS